MRDKVLQMLLLLALAIAPASAGARSLNFEVHEPIGPDPFSRYVYVCTGGCTEPQFAAATAPPGTQKQPPKVTLFNASTVYSLPTPPAGVAAGYDLIPEIPGEEFVFTATVLSGTLLGFSAQGPLAVTQVQRDTGFTYEAGQVVHEVIDTEGDHYILFLFDLAASQGVDLGQVGSLASLPLQTGWSYESRVLAQDLQVDSGGLATVFSQAGIGTYQRYAVVPEPSAGALLGMGFATLVALQRRRRRVRTAIAARARAVATAAAAGAGSGTSSAAMATAGAPLLPISWKVQKRSGSAGSATVAL